MSLNNGIISAMFVYVSMCAKSRNVGVCEDRSGSGEGEERGRGRGRDWCLLRYEGEPAIRSLNCEERANILRQNAGKGRGV